MTEAITTKNFITEPCAKCRIEYVDNAFNAYSRPPITTTTTVTYCRRHAVEMGKPLSVFTHEPGHQDRRPIVTRYRDDAPRPLPIFSDDLDL